MGITRREVVSKSALSAAVFGVSGCLGRAGNTLGQPENTPSVAFSGNVDAREPLTESAGLSTEESYPRHYSKLVTSKNAESEEIRWEYIEQELPGLVDDLEGTDFDSEFLLFFGLVLPRTKQLQPGETVIKDGTLHAEYHVEPDTAGSSEIVVNTAIKRVVADPPENVEVTVRL